MKNKFLIVSYLVLILMATITSCKKDAFNINENPNTPTDATISYNVILPGALSQTGRIMANSWGWLQNWMGFWARSGTYAPNSIEESYQITTGFQAGLWTGLYDNLFDYQAVINGAKKEGAPFYEGIGRIMKAHNYQILVDLYGNVPYFNALKGNGNTTPSYDKGLVIYSDLFRQLDTAQALIASADPSIGLDASVTTNDIMFKGNQVLWQKFANTLKLRMLVHMKNVTAFPFAAEVAKIATNGNGYLTTGQNAEVNPGYTTVKQNPFFDSYVRDNTGAATANSVYYKANDYAIRYYGYNGDPRRARFYTPVGTAFRGVAYGLPPITANAAATLSGIGPALTKTNVAPQTILSSVESMFLQAEAINRTMLPGGPAAAQAMYRNAVTESFLSTGLTAAAAAAYFTANATYPDVDYTVSSTQAGQGNGLYAILSQKWFALNGISPLEVWTDYRRTNIVYGSDPVVGFDPGPAISVSPSNTSTIIPVRLLYPQNEYNYNSANVAAEGTINQFTSKIFWDN
jgi:hypothetical protein